MFTGVFTMLKNKICLVTGGSRGIGAAICEELARRGADIAIIYCGSAGKAEEIRQKCLNLGVRAQAYKCDVKSFGECGETVKKIAEELGSPDILVNNAGITRDGLVMSMKEEDFNDVIGVNLGGAFNMIRHCSRGFIRKKSGKIINISSVAGIDGNRGQANYAASKAGIIGLTKIGCKGAWQPRHMLQCHCARAYRNGYDRRNDRKRRGSCTYTACTPGKTGGSCNACGVSRRKPIISPARL